MKTSGVNLTASKLTSLSSMEGYAAQLKKQLNYQDCSHEDLVKQNKRILQILKNVEDKVDKELEIQKKNMLSSNPNHKNNYNPDQMKVLTETQHNSNKLLGVITKKYQNIMSRKKTLEQGLEQKIIQRKNQLADAILEAQKQVKRLRAEQEESGKKLANYHQVSQADNMKEYYQIEEELKVYSAKYVKILNKHNKITDQLAIASDIDLDFEIPDDIYNRQLEKKEEAQYKEYQSIVKLCTILSKRNDSQNNKSQRIYREKLKELQKTIHGLTELEKSIAIKQKQILEGRKNVNIIKLKMEKKQKIEKDLFRVSQSTKISYSDRLRHKSYSSAKLDSNFQRPEVVMKLRSRGLSYGKLPINTKL